VTRVVGRPEEFAADAVAGLCDLYPDLLASVPGGVVRARPGRDGKVAVVVGGGSGHYPAFAGYVGAGLADGAVCGDVFASPSTARVASVVRAAYRGGGVLLGFGNYAGDVLNFGAAAEQLRAEGIDVRVLPVTDDVASAPAGREAERRGVAGDLVVFKVAGAAAEAGRSLDEVERIARRANDRTRSLGVAFTGCTLPGAREPLFRVEAGRMGVGMGIHGEAGVREGDMLPADGLAALLVDGLLAEAPEPGPARVAAVLNGLGGTKYEELFALWHALAPRLRAAGLEPVAAEAGEFVTSLDMAGCSLTLAWLDDELEELWLAPSEAIGFPRRRSAAAPVAGRVETAAVAAYPPATDASRAAASRIAGLLEEVAGMLADHEEELGRLDAQAGDGDHGQGMARGSASAASAARAAADAGAGACSTLAAAGSAWAERAGGSSGALWGAMLGAIAGRLSDQAAPTGADVVAGVEAACAAVQERGGAHVGDKTLVDALVPFATTLAERHAALGALVPAWAEAAQAARAGADGTALLAPRLGRARTAGERNVGHVDAGAVSLGLVVATAGTALGRSGADGRQG